MRGYNVSNQPSTPPSKKKLSSTANSISTDSLGPVSFSDENGDRLKLWSSLLMLRNFFGGSDEVCASRMYCGVVLSVF